MRAVLYDSGGGRFWQHLRLVPCTCVSGCDSTVHRGERLEVDKGAWHPDELSSSRITCSSNRCRPSSEKCRSCLADDLHPTMTNCQHWSSIYRTVTIFGTSRECGLHGEAGPRSQSQPIRSHGAIAHQPIRTLCACASSLLHTIRCIPIGLLHSHPLVGHIPD